MTAQKCKACIFHLIIFLANLYSKDVGPWKLKWAPKFQNLRISNFLWRKRRRCVHVGFSGHKTAETLLIFSIIYNEVGMVG